MRPSHRLLVAILGAALAAGASVDVPLSHPPMHTLYDVKDMLQVSSINFWCRSGGSVSERSDDSGMTH